MFGNALSGWHLLILLAVVLLLFGAAKLPRLAQSVGQSMRVFKSEVKTMKEENEVSASPLDDAPVVPAASVVAPPLRAEPPRQNLDA
ncbi:Sec-independent protein translocase subunit TatA [Microbacterium sp. W4I20]|jgi:sec-independent protein translocase protein TatA|uniref:Sec-independent protein translocase subunit TatA n=1 Tax=Microbacterium sp. W4I20 TaxID=3042262 RepID=UPI00278617F7|nr:Sec-independent protein translocase subunit TatA [Microbacterium sp. W4I20]MDQ0727613.1 sec-independent protein translocase protein TatA [Microbacterium sp. W4I20]